MGEAPPESDDHPDGGSDSELLEDAVAKSEDHPLFSEVCIIKNRECVQNIFINPPFRKTLVQ